MEARPSPIPATRVLVGVTELYRARSDTKMNITAELLAVIAALGPITLLSSVMGIKVIVNESTRSIRVEASSSAAPRVVSAVMPTEVNHHRSMVGRKHAVNGIPRDEQTRR
jgi:hypothetical protein